MFGQMRQDIKKLHLVYRFLGLSWVINKFWVLIGFYVIVGLWVPFLWYAENYLVLDRFNILGYHNKHAGEVLSELNACVH